MTLLPLKLCFSVKDALQQDGIFRHHAPLLELQDLDQRALLSEFIFPSHQFVWDDLTLAGAPQAGPYTLSSSATLLILSIRVPARPSRRVSNQGYSAARDGYWSLNEFGPLVGVGAGQAEGGNEVESGRAWHRWAAECALRIHM